MEEDRNIFEALKNTKGKTKRKGSVMLVAATNPKCKPFPKQF
jgi:hypothetical protein